MSAPGALEDVLRRIADGETSRAELHEVLRHEPLLVPGVKGSRSEHLELQIAELQGGGTAAPLFSSLERMQEVGGPDEAAAVPFSALASGWPQGIDAVLDPGHPWALLVPADVMAAGIAETAPPIVREHPAGEVPAALLADAAAALAGVPAVQAAWSVLARFPDREDAREHLVVGIHLTDPAAQGALVEALRPAIGPHRREDQPIDLALIDPGEDEPVTQALVATEPFYRA